MPVSTRIPTPLPARPAASSVEIDSTHRLLAALLERDLGGAAALFAPTACVWWSQRGSLASVEGADASASALAELLERTPPTRLAVIPTAARTTVTSAYVDEVLAWSLELRVEETQIVGALLRGTALHTDADVEMGAQRLRRYSPPTA
jgi:hypothetical protein